ncbi:RNA polymerase sigma factor (sigma-70 family) [Dyadobacter jejuensis]|uniref:RNA polymerase sigma factor (Sigma-70 family) n=1 Tax=Dyadobacter jejuensis TaxID=1082580 RepID=A0A316ABE7_9BACT|nr:RNA polymerase sigma factor [Dyadobacter jejuensis]PWJ55045.1 RNA polymerase sigma factor (sigma-70 family) [Dyadobacter jejuensis]
MNNFIFSDEVLWCRLIEGEEASFTKLFERFYPNLLRYGKSFLSDTDKIHDCIQDVFVDIWYYRASLCRTVSVKAYLLSCLRKRIGRSKKVDLFFRQTTSLEEVTFSIDFTVEDHLIANEEVAYKVNCLNKHINALSPRQKEALYLRYHQELKTEQIAEILNINYQSANNLLHRALIQLRRDLKDNPSLFMLLVVGCN